MVPTLDELTVADPPAAWSALGFAVEDDLCVVGDVRIRLAGADAGRGLLGWSLREVAAGKLDGLATARSDREPPGEAPSHPNGITALDHVVAISPDLDRTVAVLEGAGLDLRRIREEPTPAGAPRQAFFRLGATILEVVQEPAEAAERAGGGDRPAFFWGLAFVAPDLDATVAGIGPERAGDVEESRLAADLELGTIEYGDERGFGPLLRAEPLPGGEEADPASPAVIFFTSGSTGPAKGVTHTRESLRWMIASAAAAFELEPGDVFLPGSSMSHIGSFLWALSALAVGGKVVVARTTDSHELLPLLRQHQPSVMAMIPAALLALVRDHDLRPGDLSCLRICRSGSDKVSTELLTEFAAAAGFPIVEGYGMTEVGLATLNPPSGEIKQGSIGPPIGGYSVALRGEDGEPVAAETVGRIWIRTRSRMAGYWQAPEATAEVVRDEWLDSGDLARADADGYLWFFGRKKQVIVHDGSNISPLEVESALDEHPAVAEAGVVGIHDSVHGENVRAYVTLREGAEPPSSADLIVFARERVGYKAPEEVLFLDEMPLNPTGKIDRVGLKRMAEDHLHPHGLE